MNRTHRTGWMLGALLGGAMTAALVAPAPALAQNASTADPRWTAWVGCWQATAPVAAPASESAGLTLGDVAASPVPNAPVVCIVPTQDPSTVDVATIANGKIAARDQIAATGARRSRSHDGCTGWESATWSADGDRVYLRSEDSCPRGLTRTSTGVLSMAPDGDWLDVQGVNVSGHTGVRVVRYRNVTAPAALPADLAATLRVPGATAVSTARMAAASPLDTKDVIEASHQLDPAVTEAWLLARGQRFTLSGQELVALADAGVPGRVTDAMVAVSYPKAFALGEPGDEGPVALARSAPDGDLSAAQLAAHRAPIPVFMDPYDYSPYGYGAYGYSPYYGYGYSPFGYLPYGSGYGYAPYGYAPYLGGWGAPPVIVLRGNQTTTVGGRIVNGRGYSNPRASGSNDGRTAHTRPTQDQSPPQSSTQSPPPPPPEPTRTAHQRP